MAAVNASKRVSFGGKSVTTYAITKSWMSSSRPKPRRVGYRRSKRQRELCPVREMRRARKEAVRLARELGTSYDHGPMPNMGVAATNSLHCGPERWLIDTGSAFDLIGKNDVPGLCIKMATATTTPVELSTANGRMIVGKEVLMQVGPFQQHVSPLLLEHPTGSLRGKEMYGGRILIPLARRATAISGRP